MYASLADRSSRRLINNLARVDLLVIDEMGYLNLRPEQTNVFFKLMEERYLKRPTIITTNLEYEDWHGFLGNKVLIPIHLTLNTCPASPISKASNSWNPLSRPSNLHSSYRVYYASTQPAQTSHSEHLVDVDDTSNPHNRHLHRLPQRQQRHISLKPTLP